MFLKIWIKEREDLSYWKWENILFKITTVRRLLVDSSEFRFWDFKLKFLPWKYISRLVDRNSEILGVYFKNSWSLKAILDAFRKFSGHLRNFWCFSEILSMIQKILGLFEKFSPNFEKFSYFSEIFVACPFSVG